MATSAETIAVQPQPEVQGTFFQSAKELWKRGIPVVPIPPKEKGSKLFDWTNKASTDPAQLGAWKKQNPDQNAGAVCKNDGVCVLDLDDVNVRNKMPKLLPKTFTVQSAKGLHFYFNQTDSTRALGNTSVSDSDKHHLFDFQQHNKYVVGPNSIHPTGAVYTIINDAPIADCPDWLCTWIKEMANPVKPESKPKSKPTSGITITKYGPPATKEQFENWLELHDEAALGEPTYDVNHRLEYIRAHRCPWESEHTNKNGEKDFAIYFNDDGKLGVHCVHSHPKTWDDYRAFLIDRTGHDFNMKTGKIIIPEPAIPEAEPLELPVYPLSAWDGTLYGEYAKLACADNYVAPELFVESLKTVCGAVMADRVKSNVANTNSRFYTILIAPSGTGKGTAMTWAQHLFDDYIEGSEIKQGLLWKLCGENRPDNRKVGAQQAILASEVGLIHAIEHDPHCLIVAEELNAFVSPLQIQGCGERLMNNLLNLKDTPNAQFGLSRDRKSVPHTAYLSILTGGTKTIWEESFVGVKGIDAGALNRFNLVASENEEVVPALIEPDFSGIRSALFHKFENLSHARINIELDSEAIQALNKWFKSPLVKNRSDVKKRINIIAIQNAMHLTWLLDNEEVPSPLAGKDGFRTLIVTKDVMVRAIALANYEIEMRVRYAVIEGNDNQAMLENKIRRVVSQHKKITMRELKRRVHADRVSTYWFARAIQGLISSGEIQVAEPERKYGKNTTTTVVWHGDGEEL